MTALSAAVEASRGKAARLQVWHVRGCQACCALPSSTHSVFSKSIFFSSQSVLVLLVSGVLCAQAFYSVLYFIHMVFYKAVVRLMPANPLYSWHTNTSTVISFNFEGILSRDIWDTSFSTVIGLTRGYSDWFNKGLKRCSYLIIIHPVVEASSNQLNKKVYASFLQLPNAMTI